MTQQKFSFWSYYLKNPKINTTNNSYALSSSLNTLNNTVTKEPSIQAKRIYDIAYQENLTGSIKNSYDSGATSQLDNNIKAYLEKKNQEKTNEINTFSFIGSRIWSFFKKARYLFMSIAMLALLVGYSIKGELSPYVVFAAILSVLAIYLIGDIISYFKGTLFNEELRKDITQDAYNACIIEAINAIKAEKNKNNLAPLQKERQIKYIKHLFSQYKQEKDRNLKHEHEKQQKKNYLSNNILENIIWVKCQELIDTFKQEEVLNHQKNIDKSDKESIEKINLLREKSIEFIDETKREQQTATNQIDNKDKNCFAQKRAITNEYKIKIDKQKNKLKHEIKIVKQEKATYTKTIKAEIRSIQRTINQETLLIRSKVLTDGMLKIGLNDQQGITEDQLDDFLTRIETPLKETIDNRLMRYRYQPKNKETEE